MASKATGKANTRCDSHVSGATRRIIRRKRQNSRSRRLRSSEWRTANQQTPTVTMTTRIASTYATPDANGGLTDIGSAKPFSVNKREVKPLMLWLRACAGEKRLNGAFP